jgi:predicted Zn-dependent protease
MVFQTPSGLVDRCPQTHTLAMKMNTFAIELRALAVLFALATLPGCSVNPATGEQAFTLMSPGQEAEVGRGEHDKLVKQFGGVYGDRALVDYVERIGQRLAASSEMPDLKFTFTVLNDDLVNAMALPGGYVYITRGLIALATDEAEMAGVLGHEIGHVVARHTAQRYSRAVAANLGLTILGALTNTPGLGQIASLGAEAYLQSFSREQELEADMLGARYLARSGYDPKAMTTFLQKMQLNMQFQAQLKGQTEAEPFNIMATHPRTSDRIEQAIALANIPAGSSANERHQVQYMKAIDGLVFGDDPKQGVRRGQDFLHPDLRFAFKIPEGFRMTNTPERVVAQGPDQSVIVFDMASRQGAARANDVLRYLTDVWAAEHRLSKVERITVNGMSGATGSLQVDTQGGLKDIRLVAIRDSADRIYRFQFITKAGMTERLATDLQRTTYSIRTLSPAEAAAIKPLRVRTLQAQQNASIATLAARMPFGPDNQAWFRMLNGLPPDATVLPASMWIKTVEG